MIGTLRRLFDGGAITERVVAASDRLAAERTERDRHQAVLDEAEAALQRARDAIGEADSAERELEAAEAAAASDAALWAESGGKQHPKTDAFDRAARAREQAYRTRLRADGVRKAIPKLESDVGAARMALAPMEWRIDAAAAEIVVREAGSEIEALRAEFAAVFKRYARLCALRNLLCRNVPGTPWASRMHPCDAMTHADCRGWLDEQLSELTAYMREPHPDDSIEAAKPFVARFRQLRDET